MARLLRLGLKRQVLPNTGLTLPSWVFTFRMLSPPPDPTTITIRDYPLFPAQTQAVLSLVMVGS